jgi:hypothetical protein
MYDKAYRAIFAALEGSTTLPLLSLVLAAVLSNSLMEVSSSLQLLPLIATPTHQKTFEALERITSVCLLRDNANRSNSETLSAEMQCSNLILHGRSPNPAAGSAYYARRCMLSIHRTVKRCPPFRFQTEKQPSWAPAKETFDEKDRQKAIQISMRFDDADRNK